MRANIPNRLTLDPIAAQAVAIGFLIFGACSPAGPGGEDSGGGDAATPDGTSGETHDGAPAAPDARSCAEGAPCPPDNFCGVASRTCVSAVVQVVAGAFHTCAAHRDGQVSCWGLAESINAGGNAVVRPSFLAEPRAPLALSAGTHQTCAISRERQVRCWGNQAIAVTREDGSRLADVRQVAVGRSFACAANGEGTFCWGRNDQGSLARPPEVTASAAALLANPSPPIFLGAGLTVVSHDGPGGGDRLCAWGHNGTHLVTASDAINIYASPVCNPLGDVQQLTVGADHACVRHAAGTFSCWGERYYGQLGLGGTPSDTVDVPPFGSATALSAAVTELSAGASHTCALRADGAVACFGLNSLGQVGPAPGTSEEEVRAPAVVTGLPGPVVALGGGSSAQHTCVILADGLVACWGQNHAGQLGDAPATVERGRFSASPVPVRW